MIGNFPKLLVCQNPECGKGYYLHQSTDPEFCRNCIDKLKRDQISIHAALSVYLFKVKSFRRYLKETGRDLD